MPSDISLLYAARDVRGFGDGFAIIIVPPISPRSGTTRCRSASSPQPNSIAALCDSNILRHGALIHRKGRLPLWVIRYRSLGAENRFMSAMPRKRRLAVKASSVAMGHKLSLFLP
jgi:hypothetical protein